MQQTQQQIVKKVPRNYFSIQFSIQRLFLKHYLLKGLAAQPAPTFSVTYVMLFLLLLFFTGIAIAADDIASPTASPKKAQSLNDVQSGQLLIRDRDNNSLYSSLLLSSDAHFNITGLMAHVSIKQNFKNDTDNYVEAIYVFPLPETAAVNRLVMQIGARRIEGKIKEKAQAKRIYNQAKTAGKKASLMSQQRPNMFTTSIANIAPGETVSVELDYVQNVDYKDATFSLRFPMTITPRYIPGDPSVEEYSISSGLSWGQPTNQVPDADKITPFLARPQSAHPTITVNGSIDLGMAVGGINSAHHDIDIFREKNRYQFSFKEPESMQQDFVISWRALVGSEPKVALFTEELNGEHYALLMMLPPDQLSGFNATSNQHFPREMIYIIDTSGSMGGVSIAQAKASLDTALSQLKPEDRFNIIEFNSTTKPLHRNAVTASNENVRRARTHVASLQAEGGTEMYEALNFALNPHQSSDQRAQRLKPQENGFDGKSDNHFLRQIIFITDGAVGNEETLFKLIHTDLKDSRLFTVGIGSAPNGYFMRKAAEFGRGTHTHIGSVNEVQSKMNLLFQKISNPVARDIKISWPAKYQVETYPKRVPDLFLGEPIFLSSKIVAADSFIEGTVKLDGVTATAPWSRTLRVKDTPASSGISTLWARRKITSLQDEETMGANIETTKQAIIDVALNHRLVSKYTSFVAVEEVIKRAKNALKQLPIPNAAPKGQATQTFAYPNTATSAGDHFYYAGLLLILAFMISLLNPDIMQRLRYGKHASIYDLLEK
jgi:Ca-activated chloride channel family protein